MYQCDKCETEFKYLSLLKNIRIENAHVFLKKNMMKKLKK
jgi:hypothetical protein